METENTNPSQLTSEGFWGLNEIMYEKAIFLTQKQHRKILVVVWAMIFHYNSGVLFCLTPKKVFFRSALVVIPGITLEPWNAAFSILSIIAHEFTSITISDDHSLAGEWEDVHRLIRGHTVGL